MGKEIRKIQIFIVTRNEVPNEFTEIRDFTNQINRHLEKAYSVSVDLLTIDDLDAPPQKQEKYKQQICESEIVFFLIFTEMDDFMKADFEAAFEKMKKDGKPDIYTYFYKGEDREPKPLVREFIANLENGINHYWSVYSHIDTIKLKILMCLKLSKLDMVEMEFRDGKLVIDNRDVMPLDNVPMFADNDSMKSLKAKLQTVEEEYFATKALYLEDKQNDDVRKKYIELSTERENLKQKMEETEKQLFTQSLNMIRTSRGELTPRQREAYRLFEAGKSEAANEMLDSEEMKNDFKRKMQKRKEEDKKLATVHIQEFKTKIEILETMTEYKERFSEIVDAYEEIMETVFEYGVEYDSVCDYIGFLHEQGDSKKALEIGKELEQIYNEDEQIPLYDKLRLWNVLGVVTNSIPGMQIETEKYYKKAISVGEKLVNINCNKYSHVLAYSYNDIGAFYDAQGEIEQAKYYYFKSIEILEKAIILKNAGYLPHLASNYNNIGGLYFNQENTEQAEIYYNKAIEIYEILISEGLDEYLSDLAIVYNSYGYLYYIKQDVIKAEHYYIKSKKIYEELVSDNKDKYSATLALIYSNMGALYSAQKKFKQANDYLLSSIKIREWLVINKSDMYMPDLADSYYNTAILYNKQSNIEQTEHYFSMAIAIRTSLAKKDPKKYECDLAISYFNYAFFKQNNSYLEVAFELAKKNTHNLICRKIVQLLTEFFNSTNL